MRNDSLKMFERDIKSIREYIKHIELIQKVGTDYRNSSEKSLEAFNSHLREFRTDKKIFEYKAIVISLYGVLEKYINIWVQEHVNGLPNIIDSYGDLSNEFRENHFDLSIKLISLITEKKYIKNENLEKRDVLTKLNSCINDSGRYDLNTDAFSPKSGNLKHLKIADALKLLGIQLGEKFKQNKKFTEFVREKHGLHKRQSVFDKIDDLVLRRNEIAHGGDTDNILAVTEFEDYIIKCLEFYGQAIFDTIVEKEIEYEIVSCKKIPEIKEIVAQHILCFEIKNHTIRVGDYIIIVTADGYHLKKKILEIQKDRESYQELIVDETLVTICVDLGDGIKDNQKFYIRPSL